MNDNIYKSPDANPIDGKNITFQPSPFVVSFWLILTSVGVGLALFLIEYLIGKPLSSSTNTITTIVPAIVLGSYCGSKRGELFTPAFRHTVILGWLIGNIVIVGAIIFLIDPSIIDMLRQIETGFIAIFLAFLVFGYFISYFLFRQGEKGGIKKWEKNNKI